MKGAGVSCGEAQNMLPNHNSIMYAIGYASEIERNVVGSQSTHEDQGSGTVRKDGFKLEGG